VVAATVRKTEHDVPAVAQLGALKLALSPGVDWKLNAMLSAWADGKVGQPFWAVAVIVNDWELGVTGPMVAGVAVVVIHEILVAAALLSKVPVFASSESGVVVPFVIVTQEPATLVLTQPV